MTPHEFTILAEARAILAKRALQGPCITSWTALEDYLVLSLAGQRHESFRVLFLDKKNRLIEDFEFSSGTVDHVQVYPREVLRKALELDACAMILAHNHPSGDPTPSQSDIDMTRQISKGCEIFGVTLHDHVIVGGPITHSMRSHNEI